MYYAIIGRAPGDDEDSIYVCRAANRSEAESLFIAEVESPFTLDELETMHRIHGFTTTISFVLVSECEIKTFV